MDGMKIIPSWACEFRETSPVLISTERPTFLVHRNHAEIV